MAEEEDAEAKAQEEEDACEVQVNHYHTDLCECESLSRDAAIYLYDKTFVLIPCVYVNVSGMRRANL